MYVGRVEIFLAVAGLLCIQPGSLRPERALTQSTLPRRPQPGVPVPGVAQSSDLQILLNFKASQTNQSRQGLEQTLHWIDTESQSFCTAWAGLTCNDDGRVVTVNLTRMSLSGPLPVQFSQLVFLEELYLDDNFLEGTLPPEWTSLTKLRNLTISSNSITGTLPPQWGSFPSLQLLALSKNRLQGTLPPEWANLTVLDTLKVDTNMLRGNIPEEWSGMVSIRTLYLRNNRLFGTLPAAWDSLQELEDLAISANLYLSSELPVSWANMSKLQSLYLGQMSLTGTLPDAWGQRGAFPALQFLILNNNTLSGTLPASWFSQDAFPSMKLLSLEGNKLHGTIPPVAPNSGIIGAANVTLVPQKDCPACGICGGIPSGFPLLNTTTQQAAYDLPPCSGGAPTGPAVNVPGAIIGAVVGGVIVLLAGAFGFLIRWKFRRKRPQGGLEKVPSPKLDTPLSPSDTASAPSNLQSPGRQASNVSDSAQTLHAGSSVASWQNESNGAADGSPLQEGQLSSDALNTAAYSLAVGEVAPEDVDIVCKNSKKQLLGRGSYGEVYLGKWQHTLVAVKFLIDQSEEQQTLFRREAELLRSLRHPNVVSFLGCCMQPGKMMVITEFLPGGNLRKAISNDTAPRHLCWSKRGLPIAADIAKGIAFLHHRKIIHFDIKSGNVLLAKNGSAKISDVGLSKLTTGSLTKLSVDRGTFDYMAPELLTASEASVASDTYSFGVVMHEIITGEAPDRRRGFRVPRVPEECPQEAVDLMFACLSHTPSSRPKMVHVVEQLLEWITKRQAKQGRSAPLRPNPTLPGRRAPGSQAVPGETGEGAPAASLDDGSLPTPFRDRANSAKAAM